MNLPSSKKIMNKSFDYDCRYGGVKLKTKSKKDQLFKILKKNVKKHTMNHHLNQQFWILDQFFLKKGSKNKKRS